MSCGNREPVILGASRPQVDAYKMQVSTWEGLQVSTSVEEPIHSRWTGLVLCFRKQSDYNI